MRIVTALRLFFTNPSTFVARTKSLVGGWVVHARLKKLAQAGSLPVFVDYKPGKWPFYDDNDSQEIGYHLNFNEWYSDLLSLFAPYITPGSVVIDVGANLGFTTLLFARMAGMTGAVHSFEPGNQMAGKLEAMVTANELQNVHVYRMGLGSQLAELELAIPEYSGNASLSFPSHLSGKKVVIEKVRIERLDDAIGNSLSRLDFLKIDTEGFEFEVLRGAEQTISRLKPVIYIELAQDFMQSSQASVNLLKKLGYRFTVEPDLEKARNGDNFLALPPP